MCFVGIAPGSLVWLGKYVHRARMVPSVGHLAVNKLACVSGPLQSLAHMSMMRNAVKCVFVFGKYSGFGLIGVNESGDMTCLGINGCCDCAVKLVLGNYLWRGW